MSAGILVLNEQEIRSCISYPEVIEAMEQAFVAYSNKAASLPAVINLDVPDRKGEVHVKAGYLHGAPEYVVKIASGFWENRRQNLPISSGMMLAFSSETGFPSAILLDNALLTEIRTAAAGAVAAKYMSTLKLEQVAILGAGSQGRFQLEALTHVRSLRRVKIYDHKAVNIDRFLTDMRPRIEAELQPAFEAKEAIRGSQLIITATPSKTPIVKAEWVERGMHFTALGSDGPDKQELEVGVLAKANRIIADSIPQCLRLGEIHHAVEAGILREKDVDGELGDVIAGRVPGRTREDEITICDLTGVGVQDAAIAGLICRKAATAGLGRLLQ